MVPIWALCTQQKHGTSDENPVRGRPGLRLRPPSRALGSLVMPRGGVGLTEVSGKGVDLCSANSIAVQIRGACFAI